ncbi:MAG: glycine oxidase ThiO [Myxococcota bacterium]|nr:glycine oxidase ThiO [Myxococcota bacterium]
MPPLTDSPSQTEHDVLIVGGGIHGCALARELALRGRDVVVLEKSVPGAEASSAAGGILGPHLEADHGKRFLDFGRYSLGLYPRWIQALESESGVSTGFRPCGGIRACFNPESLGALKAQAATWEADGLPVHWCDASELREIEPRIGEALGGIRCPEEAQVDPRALMKALTIAARRSGVRFVMDRVVGIEAEEALSVRCASGLRRAKQVVVAAGAWSATLPGCGLPQGAVQPARGQMLMLKLPEPPCGSVIFSERGYAVARPDGHVLVGSTLEFEGFQKGVTAEGMSEILAMALQMLPALAKAKFVDAWSGFRPWTTDHLPIVGPAEPRGLWLSTGHYRNGILLAPGSAALLADMMSGVEAAIDASAFAATRITRPDPS